MRLFRRARDTKTSVIRREAVSAVVDAEAVSLLPSSSIAPIVDSEPNLSDLASGELLQDSSLRSSINVPPSPPSYDGLDDSDVFVCEQSSSPSSSKNTSPEVTLFVHHWHNVEPGLLSWKFPSLRSALDAVQRMKNAIGWCVVSGTGWTDLDVARTSGAVLVEQLS